MDVAADVFQMFGICKHLPCQLLLMVAVCFNKTTGYLFDKHDRDGMARGQE